MKQQQHQSEISAVAALGINRFWSFGVSRHIGDDVHMLMRLYICSDDEIAASAHGWCHYERPHQDVAGSFIVCDSIGACGCPRQGGLPYASHACSIRFQVMVQI